MVLTTEGRKHIEDKKKTVDQWILDPNIFIKDFPLDPATKWIKTNNFMQQSLARILGYDYTNNQWARMRIDVDGRLEVAGVTTLSQANIFAHDGSVYAYLRMSTEKALWQLLYDRDAMDATVLDAVSAAAGAAVSHGGLDVQKYTGKTLLVSTTTNCNVYIQFSDNNIDWYDWCDAAGAAITFACNNSKKAFSIDDHCHYIRTLIHNTDGSSASTITAIFEGVV